MTDPNRPVTGYPAPPPIPNGYSTAGSAGTTNAYTAPPAYQNPYPYYNAYHPDPYARRATFIRRIFAIVIASVIIAGTIVFIIWLVLRPRLPEFRVDSFSLSKLNLSSSTSLLSANWEASFFVHNPNKKITLSYDSIEADVFFQSQALSETTMPPFFQDTRSETTIRASFAASGAYVDKSIVDGINSERSSRDGTVGFNVRMVAWVRFKAGAWRARKRFMKVYCGDLGVRISSNSFGSLVGGPKQCKVGL